MYSFLGRAKCKIYSSFRENSQASDFQTTCDAEVCFLSVKTIVWIPKSSFRMGDNQLEGMQKSLRLKLIAQTSLHLERIGQTNKRILRAHLRLLDSVYSSILEILAIFEHCINDFTKRNEVTNVTLI